jgi:hypothetical protein
MMLTIDLPDKLEAALKTKAQMNGLSTASYAVRVLEQDLTEDGTAPPGPVEHRPISQIIADIMKDAPPEELAKLPTDGASEHDHYIYGWPKRNQ